jgi:hypothetical protein
MFYCHIERQFAPHPRVLWSPNPVRRKRERWAQVPLTDVHQSRLQLHHRDHHQGIDGLGCLSCFVGVQNTTVDRRRVVLIVTNIIQIELQYYRHTFSTALTV